MWRFCIFSLKLMIFTMSNSNYIPEVGSTRISYDKLRIQYNWNNSGLRNPWVSFDPAASRQGRNFITTDKTQKLENKSGRKSEKYCKYYSKWLKSDFGNIKGRCSGSLMTKIVGGQKASPLEFPHMARWGYQLDFETYIWFCGASLISEEYLLTAAHCGKNKKGPFVARLGAGKPESQIIVNIKKILTHPKYDPEKNYYDIALLRLETRITQFSDYIRPACLQTEFEIPEGKAISSGWGLTSKGKFSGTLMKVTLPILSNSKCDQIYIQDEKLFRGIDENSMICGGGRNTNKATCGGDSGGPLQIKKENLSCMYSIIGIVSFGSENCDNASVFTRVSYFIPWIESIVWP